MRAERWERLCRLALSERRLGLGRNLNRQPADLTHVDIGSDDARPELFGSLRNQTGRSLRSAVPGLIEATRARLEEVVVVCETKQSLQVRCEPPVSLLLGTRHVIRGARLAAPHRSKSPLEEPLLNY